MHVAVVGAFPVPLAQGSQTFALAQARALQDAGAGVSLVCYGHGSGSPPDDLELVRPPRALSPVPLAAGPHPGKLVADLALLSCLVRCLRERCTEVVLAHNAEAGLVAVAARRLTRVPFVYVAHTLMRHELPTYLGPGWRRARPLARSLGATLDASLARNADAIIVLSHHAERCLRAFTRAPVVRIPPALEPGAPPSEVELDALCKTFRLAREGFVLYSGNLDRYQELELLARAARRVAFPVVIATHGAEVAPAPLRTLRVQSFETMRALCFAARIAVAPRLEPGGFPIKLLNYMEASRPIVAHRRAADGLVADRSALLLESDAGPSGWASALERLFSDPALARRLGRGGRELLEREHRPAAAAAAVLRLAREVAAGRPR